mgnify:CR=1 FL=1
MGKVVELPDRTVLFSPWPLLFRTVTAGPLGSLSGDSYEVPERGPSNPLGP